jgi:thiamine pyrophosphate-dependent acetolactate synthase large subunit-like protein
MSDPKGPVYIYGAREILEQEIKPYKINQNFWSPVGSSALPDLAIKSIAESLVNAESPLVITGYSGRNHAVPQKLLNLTTLVPHARVLDTGGSDMCFPASDPSWLGLSYGLGPSTETADVILVLDCDVPWVNTRCKPKADAVIYHVDVDPLKQQIPVFYIDAVGRWRADSEIAIGQICDYIKANQLTNQAAVAKREIMVKGHNERLKLLAAVKPLDNGQYGADFLCNQLKKFCPQDTIWCVEAVTQTLFAAEQIQAHIPGSWLNCGGGGLGWSGGGKFSCIRVQD